ncbi:hypothetical protein CEB3_c31160 [Peptococcaceae bacterium CEB3]|nr:hypothetical protein CEB3_c31160 [Peptococcaceae bacterium CEB3]
MGYDIVNLKDMLNEVGEELTKDILSSYLCPKNADVEYFLHDRAIEFTKLDTFNCPVREKLRK